MFWSISVVLYTLTRSVVILEQKVCVTCNLSLSVTVTLLFSYICVCVCLTCVGDGRPRGADFEGLQRFCRKLRWFERGFGSGS